MQLYNLALTYISNSFLIKQIIDFVVDTHTHTITVLLRALLFLFMNANRSFLIFENYASKI